MPRAVLGTRPAATMPSLPDRNQLVVDESALFRAFEQYSRILLSDFDVTHVLHQLVDQAVEVLGVDGAGVCLADEDGRLRFVAATDADVAVIEEGQVEEDEGPCHDAHRSGTQVVVDDLASSEDWPAYRRVALDRGVGAVAGLPLPGGANGAIGALNLYRAAAHDWDDHELATAQLLANMASGYLATQSVVGSSERLVGQLRRALESRVVIEQAKGVLVGRHDISPNEAFTRIRALSRNTNTILRDLCADVVAGHVDPPPRT